MKRPRLMNLKNLSDNLEYRLAVRTYFSIRLKTSGYWEASITIKLMILHVQVG